MSIQLELSRIRKARNEIRTKLNELGIEPSPEANLTECATKLSTVANNGAVSAKVQEGESYKIPKGYHNGSGTVQGVAGGGNYTLQTKTVTPTTGQQDVAPDPGYYGLSAVTVEAIPNNFKDISGVTATAPDVLSGKIITTSKGDVAGTMPNNGAVSRTLDTATTSFTIPAGYHTGKGIISVVNEEKTVQPSYKGQTVTPTPGNVLSKVSVGAIPPELIDTTSANATANQILEGSTAYVGGEKITGTMPNVGGVEQALTTVKTSYSIPEGYHDGLGTVSITLESKTATPTKSLQTISPTVSKVLSEVTINPIPAEYIVTNDANAIADNILAEKTAYVKGSKVIGKMPANVATATKLTSGSPNYIIPKGYHDGEGTVSVSLESKTITPTKKLQNISPSAGQLINNITVNPIPDIFVDTTNANALAADILINKTAYVGGKKITGSMPSNGSTSGSIDGLNSMSFSIPAGYTTGGTVTLTGDIEAALAEI